MSDLRFVFRVLTRAPGFTITVLLALALGIGATTAIFSLVNGVLLQPLPYPGSDRLVMVWQDYTGRGGPVDEWASPGVYNDWRGQRDVFTSASAVGGWNAALALDGGPPEALRGEQVTHEYLATLGLTPAAGRFFEPREDIPGAPRAVVLSHDLWTSHFGASRALIGRTISIGNEPHEVVGIAPPGTRGVLTADAALWRPLRLNLGTPTYGSIFLRVVARLAPGVSHEEASERLTLMARALEPTRPSYRQVAGRVQRAQDWIVGDARLPLLVLLAAVVTLLALTVANIANLLLARATSRDREMSIRAAIGASRGRLVRLMMLESLVLSLAGGALGLLVAAWSLSGLLALIGDILPRAAEVRLDASALGVAALLAAVTGLLFGLAPALQSSRADLQGPLRESGRSTSNKGRAARNALVVAQIALALVMLVSASLIVRSFASLRHVDLGFRPDSVSVGTVALGGSGYRTGAEVRAFLSQLEQRLQGIPGVTDAGFSSQLPLAGGGDSDTTFTIVGKPERQEDGRSRVSWYRSVSAGYFRTMGMRMARGRAMTAGAPEAVINEAFAARYFPGEDPIGRQIVSDTPPLTIVGVVADARTRGPRAATRNEMFLPYEFMPEGRYFIVARANEGMPVIPALRSVVSSIDPNVPLAQPGTMRELHADALAQPRLLATLLGAFAAAALLLALIGIYGVIAFAVGQRTSEMGIRLAMGATPGQVVRLVLSDGLRLGAIGLALGVAGGLAAANGVASLLHGVAPRDPATFAAAAVVILATAALGSWLPARRASRIAPTEALRG
ncbi:MAG TPA: ABC transporter permease [Vicinamibacterales bacterium]